MTFIKGEPYDWPYDGNLSPDNTALIIIDMQVDFCGKGGYVDCMGYDISLTQAPIEPIKRLLSVMRGAGYTIIHTREGHKPDLSDLPDNKRWRSAQIGAEIGSKGPAGRILVRGEPGWEIIPDLAPIEGEPIIDKPGKGSFYATDLDLVLHTKGIRNLLLAGITTDVCVHTTMRDANDRGLECLLLADCTAATDFGNHLAALKMVKMQGGVFGSVSTSAEVIAAIAPSAANGSLTPHVTTVVVPARPYDYTLPIEKTALINIDFQRDFIYPGGFGAALGNDVKLLEACVPAAKRLLAACRARGMYIVHTLEAHLSDLSDLPVSKLTRGNPPEGMRIGDKGDMGRILVRNEYGNGIIDELAALEGEKLLFKPGKGAFWATDLQEELKRRGITHLIITGVTTEVCVQTTMREANDRGYECVLVEDATESYFPEFKAQAVQMIIAQGGIVGWVSSADAIIGALAGA